MQILWDICCFLSEKVKQHTYHLDTGFPEHFPKAKSLIPSASHNGFPIWRQGQIKHSTRMASEVCNSGQTGILPHTYFVPRVAMGTNLQQTPKFPQKLELKVTVWNGMMSIPNSIKICTVILKSQVLMPSWVANDIRTSDDIISYCRSQVMVSLHCHPPP
jgi:hypothetical protein